MEEPGAEEGPLLDELADEEHDVFEKVDELITRGQLGDALRLMKDNSGRFAPDKDILVHVLYLIKIGHINILKVQWDEAKKHYKQAEEIINENIGKGPLWEKLAQKVYVEFGNMYWRLADYLKAEIYLKKAIEYSMAEDVAKGRAYIEMGNVKGERGELDDAVENYSKAIEILMALDEKFELARAFNNISDAYFKKKSYDWAVAYADKGIELNKEIGNNRNLAIGYLTGGEALVKIGDTDQAREYHNLSSEAAKNLDDDYVKGCLANFLGMIETQDENYREAERAFKEAQVKLKNTDIPFYLGRAYFENGVLYMKMEEPEKAMDVFKKALEIFEEHQCNEEAKAAKELLKQLDEELAQDRED